VFVVVLFFSFFKIKMNYEINNNNNNNNKNKVLFSDKFILLRGTSKP